MLGWIIYFLAAVLLAAALTKFKNIRRLWPMGVVTILFLYAVDRTFIALGAYSFQDTISLLGGIPIFYLLAGFPGGILFAYFYPSKKKLQLPYILIAALLFILLEIVMKWFGYFQYINWSLSRSFFIDLGSFMAILWLGQWLDATGKGLSIIKTKS